MQSTSVPSLIVFVDDRERAERGPAIGACFGMVIAEARIDPAGLGALHDVDEMRPIDRLGVHADSEPDPFLAFG